MKARGRRALADVIFYSKMTSAMALDGVMSFLRLKDVTYTCKYMRHNPTIDGTSSVQWPKVGRSWRLQMYFRRLLCVKIEIDQLYCINCWVKIHCRSVVRNWITCAVRSWFDLFYNWPPNSELLLNSPLLELIYFLIIASFWRKIRNSKTR